MDIKYKYDVVKTPLITPYLLSFTTLYYFDTIFFYFYDEKSFSIGECTVLPGYSDETIGDVVNWTESFLNNKKNENPDKLLKNLCNNNTGFKEIAVVSALETHYIYNDIWEKKSISVPIIGLLNSEDKDAILIDLDKLTNHDAIKVKIGKDPIKDADKVNFIQKNISKNTKLRLDANQGYNIEASQKFLQRLNYEKIELIEQPLPIDNWDEMSYLNRKYNKINFMLDESITNIEMINKAIKLNCCKYIKLKLFKCGSIKKMIDYIIFIKKNNMEVIIGNGVQNIIGSLYEAFIFDFLKKEGINLKETELIGPLKIKEDISDLFDNKQKNELKLYPRKILEYFKDRYLKN